jgi:tRNA uridine 5-carboxymethylaminomethyl modification enzyme
VLALPDVATDRVEAAFPWLRGLAPTIRTQLEAEALYAPYLRRQEAERRLLGREEKATISATLDFDRVDGLSAEMRQRLKSARPATLGAAGRVQGVTPAALAALAVHLRRDTQRFT